MLSYLGNPDTAPDALRLHNGVLTPATKKDVVKYPKAGPLGKRSTENPLEVCLVSRAGLQELYDAYAELEMRKLKEATDDERFAFAA